VLETSVVVVIPVTSAQEGKVDMLVVTRDIWSLRLNTQYTFQQGSLTNLSIALSENNFLGRRSVFAAGFTMDQGAIATGPITVAGPVKCSWSPHDALSISIVKAASTPPPPPLHAETATTRNAMRCMR
jgi:hypothetical protein